MSIYRIADLNVQMESFGRTVQQAVPYQIQEDVPPDLIVHSRPQELREENPHLSLEDCEYLSTGSSFYRQLVRHNGMMLHSSCVVVDGRAYLFSAPCGTGKSTHTQLWLQLFGDRAHILNDDKPAIRVLDGKIFVYGTPWSGKTDCSRNERVELGGIAVLKRGAENTIRCMEPQETLFPLLNQTVRSRRPDDMEACLATIGVLSDSGKIWELHCNMDILAAKVAYEAMSGERIEL